MGWFSKKNKEEEIEEVDEEFKPRRIRDLNPENKKLRKEPVKPWGKKERLIVLFVFLATVLGSGILAASARGFKLPNLPRMNFSFESLSSFNPFQQKTIILGQKPKDDKSKKIIDGFEKITKPLSGVYSIYIYDLESLDSYGVNEEEKMVAASLIKLPVIYAFYKEVERGVVSFDDKVKYESTTVTYRDLIRLMCKKSDNKAFSLMRQKLGDSVIQKYIDDLGLTETNLKENTTTAKEIATFLLKFWEFPLKERKEILDFLTDTIYEDYLPKGVPDNVVVAHKYGREIHVINDAGIILAKKPYILVLMTEKIVEDEAQIVLPQISKLVFDIIAM